MLGNPCDWLSRLLRSTRLPVVSAVPQVASAPPSSVHLPDSQSPEYNHNHTSNALYRLPTELLLLIADTLEPTAIVALRLTGRHFYSIFKNPESIHYEDKKKFLKIKTEDNYRWNLGREARFGVARLDKITCSQCRHLHPKSMFSTGMLKVNHEERICIGTEGKLHMCRHQSFSFEEVVALLEKTIIVAGEEMIEFRICTHPEHGTTGPELALFAPTLDVMKRKGYLHQGPYVVSRSWPLIALVRNKPATEAMVKAALGKIKEPICPHSTTQDIIQQLVDFKETPSSRKEVYRPPRPGCDIYSSGCNIGACRVCTIPPYSCAHSSCDTSWAIHRRHRNDPMDKDQIVLVLKRRIGPGPNYVLLRTDPSWVAQVTLDKEDRKGSEDNVCITGEAFLEKYGKVVDPWVLYFRSQGKSLLF